MALVGVVALVVLLPLVFWHYDRVSDRSEAVVLMAVVEVRSGPAERYTSVFTVHEGLMVRIRQSASGWHQVRLPNGLAGWVPADAVERL